MLLVLINSKHSSNFQTMSDTYYFTENIPKNHSTHAYQKYLMSRIDDTSDFYHFYDFLFIVNPSVKNLNVNNKDKDVNFDFDKTYYGIFAHAQYNSLLKARNEGSQTSKHLKANSRYNHKIDAVYYLRMKTEVGYFNIDLRALPALLLAAGNHKDGIALKPSEVIKINNFIIKEENEKDIERFQLIDKEIKDGKLQTKSLELFNYQRYDEVI